MQKETFLVAPSDEWAIIWADRSPVKTAGKNKRN